MAWNHDPVRLEALDRITQALKAAKMAKDRGFNVQQVRETLNEARRAFGAHDYRTATDLANRALEMCGTPPT